MNKVELLGRIEERLVECELLAKRTKDPTTKAFREGQRQALLECKGWALKLMEK